MKINPKILSIPPYISTSWKNIASLHVEPGEDAPILIVTLLSGVRIQIPGLGRKITEAIFAAHSLFIEQEEKAAQTKVTPSKGASEPQIYSMQLPLKELTGSMENFGSMLQHNPDQAGAPDLPPAILEKVAELSKTLGMDDSDTLPKPEPHCNCVYCQFARAMQNGLNGESIIEELPEEEVSDEDLQFKTWDISQTSDKLYIVTNPLDAKEHYNVYLGEPVGCTCGQQHCEHVRAVLSS